MALLSKIDAAIKLGLTIELIDYFVARCPKPGEARKLQAKKVDNDLYFEEDELVDFSRYLSSPWPKPKAGGRPNIPDPIAEDVKEESYYGCAICGSMDNGEVAHIDPVSETMNNSPDNLLFLCPNHHTKYDYGAKPANNLTREVINAAKLLKRESRRRRMRFEANATRSLLSLIRFLKDVEEKVNSSTDESLTETYLTESKKLLEAIPDLLTEAEKRAAEDKDASEADKLIAEKAPALAKLTIGASMLKKGDVAGTVATVIKTTDEVLIEIDEVDCPHCQGRGTVGLTQVFCAYCRGACVVTEAEAKAYKRSDIDEVDCPHCNGRGMTGLFGDLCAYCRGASVVTKEKADAYDREEIDEVDCPHCGGRGTTGLFSDVCVYCRGSQVVSRDVYKAYDRKKIDEVDCPHCSGSGTTGVVQNACAYCRGSQVVSSASRAAYRRDAIDEVDCPHCNGRGVTGLRGEPCAYCRGSNFVTAAKRAAYDREQIDEVECPHCQGRGTTGLRGDECALCKGAQVVAHVVRSAYRKKYPDRG